MSALAYVPAAAAEPEMAGERLALRLTAFFGLATFASLRYGALVTSPPAGRIVATAACATAGCAALAWSGDAIGRGPAGTLLRGLLLVATLALCLLAIGVPAHLLAPAGWNGFGAHVQSGLRALDDWLWPYRGEDPWARTTVLLVIPPALVLAGAVCFWPSRAATPARRALALLLLVGLFLAGAANAPESLPALQGLVLLALIAAALLAPAAPAPQIGRAARWLIACALAALLAESALGSGQPWLDYRDGGLGVGPSSSFQWDQLYGPISWPRSSTTMLALSQAHPTLVRVTSLDRFDGLRFLRSETPPGARRLDLGSVPPASRRAWTQVATVQVAALRSPMLAGAGGVAVSARWLGTPQTRLTRSADGAIVAESPPPPGSTYEITSYAPRPSPALARRAPRAFPAAYLPYAQFELPAPDQSALRAPDLAAEQRAAPTPARVVGPPAPGRSPASSPATAALIESSPYAPMFELARRLAHGAPSSYDVAQRIEAFLRGGYSYDEHVALRRYPLESFLFEQRRGYCQQFSGAMTLMLRMDGIPARVGAGFLPTSPDPLTGTWQIRGLDAHAWVEVFLDGIGWVSFDPTPPAALPGPIGGGSELSKAQQVGGAGAARAASRADSGRRPRLGPARSGGADVDALLGAGLAALALALALARLAGRRRLRHAFAGEAVGATAELRRALATLGRGGATVTLARLERELERDGDDGAAAYVRSLRELRYGRAAAAPADARGRAALRRALSRSRSPRTRVAAWLALPPGWVRP